ncbi:hypothetical protein [Brachybacterium saurashtrense]|nr:hypothetical protein [Brachybacterium saurashtrense]
MPVFNACRLVDRCAELLFGICPSDVIATVPTLCSAGIAFLGFQ